MLKKMRKIQAFPRIIAVCSPKSGKKTTLTSSYSACLVIFRTSIIFLPVRMLRSILSQIHLHLLLICFFIYRSVKISCSHCDEIITRIYGLYRSISGDICLSVSRARLLRDVRNVNVCVAVFPVLCILFDHFAQSANFLRDFETVKYVCDALVVYEIKINIMVIFETASYTGCFRIKWANL